MTSSNSAPGNSFLKWVAPVLLFALLVFVWFLLSALRVWPPESFPSPFRTLAALWEFRSDLASDIRVTLGGVLLGFVVTVVAAMVTAFVLHLVPRLSGALYSVLVVLQTVPLWAIAPLLFLWFGPGLLTRLVIIVLVAFFPVLVNTLQGLRDIDRELLDVFTSMKATTWQTLILLEVPSAFQMVLAGFKITLTLCVIGTVLAEMLIGDMTGLGFRIKQANAHFRVDEVFAALVLLSVLIVLLYAGLTLLAKRLEPWAFRKED